MKTNLTETELDLIFNDLMSLDKKDLCQSIIESMDDEALTHYLEGIQEENNIANEST